jgi:hypothetical protein
MATTYLENCSLVLFTSWATKIRMSMYSINWLMIRHIGFTTTFLKRNQFSSLCTVIVIKWQNLIISAIRGHVQLFCFKIFKVQIPSSNVSLLAKKCQIKNTQETRNDLLNSCVMSLKITKSSKPPYIYHMRTRGPGLHCPRSANH